jgi:hypothetical protein
MDTQIINYTEGNIMLQELYWYGQELHDRAWRLERRLRGKTSGEMFAEFVRVCNAISTVEAQMEGLECS